MIEEPWKTKSKRRDPWDRPPKSGGSTSFSPETAHDRGQQDGAGSERAQAPDEEIPAAARDAAEKLRSRFPDGSDIRVERSGDSWKVTASTGKTFFRSFGKGFPEGCDADSFDDLFDLAPPPRESKGLNNRGNVTVGILIALAIAVMVIREAFGS